MATLSYSSDRHRVAPQDDGLRGWLDEVGLGGWTLDLVHYLDVGARLIHYGDGTSETTEPVELAAGPRLNHLAVASRSGEVYIFSPQGRHVATVDALDGREILVIAYGEDDRLSEIRHAGGPILRIDRGDNGAVTLTTGRAVAHLESDDAGHLARVTDVVGAETALETDQGGLVTRVTDPDGGSYVYTYDVDGWLVAERDPLGVITRWDRTQAGSGHTVVQTASSGATTSWEVAIDGDTRHVTVTRSDGLRVTEQVESDRHVLVWPDGSTVDVQLAPDPRWGMQVPLVAQADLTLDEGELITLRTIVEVAGADADPFAATSIRESTEIGGVTYTSEWDRSERRLTFTSPEGRTASIEYDAQGRVIRQHSGSAHMSLTYGEADLLSSVLYGDDGPRLSFEYDSKGIRMRGPEGISHRFEFDAAGRETRSQVSPSGYADAARLPSGALSSVLPDGGGEGKLSYTGDGRIAQFELGGNVVRTWKYDAHGRPAGYENADGSEVSLTYDDQSRPSRVNVDGSSFDLVWDAATGHLAAMDGETVRLARRHAGSFLVAETWSGAIEGTVEQSFDDRFRVAEITVDGIAITISYDTDDLVTQVGSAVIDRDRESGAIRRVDYGELVEEREYDSFGQLRARRVFNGQLPIYQLDITRDQLGRVIERREQEGAGPTRVTAMSYDETGQLVEVVVDGAVTERYLYDQLGNRIRTLFADDPPIVSYDNAGRIIDDGELTYEYDEAGRLALRRGPDGTVRFDYDAQGLLRGVESDDGRSVRYHHDGLGRRVASTINGEPGPGLLYFDEQRPAAAVSAEGVESLFGYADDELTPLTMVKDGQKYLIVADDTGSPRLVVNADTGEVAQRIDYQAFGHVLADSAPGFQPFAFGGGIDDPVSGLVRFGHRDYDPSSGRWTAVDPILYEGGDINLYRYAGNDPVNLSDPRGLDPRRSRANRYKDLWTIVNCLIGLPEYYENCVDVDTEDVQPGPESFHEGDIDELIDPDRTKPRPGPRNPPQMQSHPPHRVERPPSTRPRPAQPPWRGPLRGKRHFGFFGGPLGLFAEFKSWEADFLGALGDWISSLNFDFPDPDDDGEDIRDLSFECGRYDVCLGENRPRSKEKGEPHITTFDGLRVSFQAAGEFVYVEDGDFTVQTRFEGSIGVATWTSATVIGSGDHVIEVVYEEAKSDSTGDAISVRIDGERRTINRSVQRVGDMKVGALRQGNAVNVYVETDTGWFIAIENLNISQNVILLAPEDAPETLGLAGSPNGDHTDDLKLRDGATTLPLSTLDTAQGLYGTYAAEWRVRPDERLFTDTPAEMWTTDEMTAVPDVVLSLGDLPPEDVGSARATCVAAGVPAGPELEDCTFDVAVTGDSSWADQQAASDTSEDFSDSRGEQRQADDPLFVAADRCRIDDLTELLDDGADVSIRRADDGWTALMFASQHDCPDVVAALLDAGADPSTPNDRGFFALYLASQNGRTEVVRLLLEGGAPRGQVLPGGDSPLFIATFRGHSEIVGLLIGGGSDPNLARADGVTPAMAAAQNSELAILRSLVAAGADVNRATFDRLSTPLHFAAGEDDVDIVSALLDAGADFDRQDAQGNTALHYAANAGVADVVRLLLGVGADPTITNSRGLSPIDVADDSVVHLFEP